ncbi:MAG: ECF-type sigma factor, partial [Blastocatellia bacterium]
DRTGSGFLDKALTEFSRHYPRAGRIVELRYFGGLTEAGAAEVLGISISTLKREWGFAKVWLLRQLSSAEPGGAGETTRRSAIHPQPNSTA